MSTPFDSCETPVQIAFAGQQAQLDTVKELVAEQQKSLAAHEALLARLTVEVEKQDSNLDRLCHTLFEQHGETRAKIESLDSVLRAQNETARQTVTELDNKLVQLGSVKNWVAWVLVIVTTSGVFQVLNHFFTR